MVVPPVRAALAQRFGRPIKASVTYRLWARHGWRKVAPDTAHPKSDPLAQADWKKLPENLAILLTPEAARGRKVRLMFQDETRFGRMVRIRRCWAPTPLRPVVSNGYEREFVYVYGAISPIEGELDWMICPKMNTERRGEFLFQIHTCHPDVFIVMVINGASSHVSKELLIPEDIRLLRPASLRPPAQPPRTHLG